MSHMKKFDMHQTTTNKHLNTTTITIKSLSLSEIQHVIYLLSSGISSTQMVKTASIASQSSVNSVPNIFQTWESPLEVILPYSLLPIRGMQGISSPLENLKLLLELQEHFRISLTILSPQTQSGELSESKV